MAVVAFSPASLADQHSRRILPSSKKIVLPPRGVRVDAQNRGVVCSGCRRWTFSSPSRKMQLREKEARSSAMKDLRKMARTRCHVARKTPLTRERRSAHAPQARRRKRVSAAVRRCHIVVIVLCRRRAFIHGQCPQMPPRPYAFDQPPDARARSAQIFMFAPYAAHGKEQEEKRDQYDAARSFCHAQRKAVLFV